MALSVLRLLEEQALKDKTGTVVATLSVDVGTYLLNEKREAIYQLEKAHGVRVVVVPDPAVLPAQFTVERIRDDDREHDAVRKNSFELADTDRPMPEFVEQGAQANIEQPAVRALAPQPPVPIPVQAPVAEPVQLGFFPRVWNALFASAPKEEKPTRTERPARRRPDTRSSNQRSRSSERGPERGAMPDRSAERGDDAQQEQRRRSGGGGGASGGNSSAGSNAQRTRNNGDARRTGQGRNGARNEDLGESQSKARIAKNEEAAAKAATEEQQEPAAAPEVAVAADAEAGQSRSRSRGRRGRRGGSRNRRSAEPGVDGEQNDNGPSANAANDAPSATANGPARSTTPAAPNTDAAPVAVASERQGQSTPAQPSQSTESSPDGNTSGGQDRNNAGNDVVNRAAASPNIARTPAAQEGGAQPAAITPPPSAASPAAAQSTPSASRVSPDDVTIVRTPPSPAAVGVAPATAIKQAPSSDLD